VGLVAEAGLTEVVLVVDAANVIGSRPTGWWKDRAGAARAFVDRLRAAVAAGRLTGPVVVVLEGKARAGVSSGVAEGVTVVHADGGGDDALVDVVGRVTDEEEVVLVTADRQLRRRAEAAGAAVVGPGWLLERLA
jgi:predicted ribonuclease YlaK